MILNLIGEKRVSGKKSDKKNMRKTGSIPAIVYAEGQAGMMISVPANDFKKAYKKSIGEVAIFNLNINGDEFRAIVKEKQIHPVSRDIVHIDFMELHKEKEITIKVPIKFIGTPKSLKEGGVLDVMRRQIEIHCLPHNIPEDIELNIEEVKIGETIHCKDIKVVNAKITEVLDTPILTVHALRTNSDEGTTTA